MEIREKIIECAGKLFKMHGTRQVSMDTIAQELGISKRTIYENFKDKNDLLKSFLEQAVMAHKKEAIEILKTSDNVIDALFAFGEFNQKAIKQVNPAFFVVFKKYHPIVFKNVMGNNQIRNYDITYTLLKRGINEGNFRREIDVEITNLFIHHTMEFFQKMEDQKNCDHRKIWISVHLPYLRGICTDKGQELVTGFMNKYKNLNDS